MGWGAERLRALILGVFLIVCHSLAPNVLAQPEELPIPPAIPGAAQIVPDAERIRERIEQLEKTGAKAAARELEFLRQAQKFLERARESTRKAAEVEQAIIEAPELTRSIEATLGSPLDEPSVDADLSLEQLERQLATARAQFDAARAQQETVSQQTASRAQRRPRIPAAIADADARLDEVQRSLALPPFEGEPIEEMRAHRIALRAEQQFLVTLKDSLQTTLRLLDAETDLQRARRQLAERHVLEAGRLVEELNRIVTVKREAAAAQAQWLAEQERRESIDAHPAVRAVAELNSELAKELSDITESATVLTADQKRVDEQRNHWAREFDRAKERLAKVGMADAVGIRLRKQRGELPDVYGIQRRVEARREAMTEAQLQQLAREDRLLELVDIAGAAEKLLEDYPDIDAAERPAIRHAVEAALLVQKNDYLIPLIKAYDSYVADTVIKLYETEQALLSLTRRYLEFIDERILWIQSSPPFQPAEIMDSIHDFLQLMHKSSWALTLEALRQDLQKKPWILVGGLLVFGFLVWNRRRIKRALHDQASIGYRRRVDPWRQTVHTAASTIVLALIWPSLLWLISWRLGAHASPSQPFIGALSFGLGQTADVLFAMELLRHVCRKDGLGERHWRWREELTALVRKNLAWMEPVSVLLTLEVTISASMSDAVHNPTFGRIPYMGLMLAFSVFFARVFHPRRGLLAKLITDRPSGWLAQLKNVWYPAAWGLPIALSLLAASGYYYTANRFTLLLFHTIGLILGSIAIYEMALRWLRVIRARLAFDEARQKRVCAQSADTTGATARAGLDDREVAAATTATENEEAYMDIATMSDQALNLLRGIMGFAIVLGTGWIWSDVLPALSVLQSVELWEVASETAAAVTDGSADAAKVKTTVHAISLAEVTVAILILVATVVVTSNIPGMLEFTVLKRLPISASGRFAIVSSVRYVLAVIGMIMAFNAIGIGWSKVQWLVAAVSVGLGFGLQEIFANFVSGLVILFERPIRVGDIVTLGNIDGTISRIRMRATTVTDWDNKELIVPNKEFITGRLVNWTLTDSITRVLIPVGIAHGSDITLAHQVLMRCAEECGYILQKPEPTAVFRSIGDSSLLFQLRVYIDGMDYYLAMLDDINTRIDRYFRESGIKVAYQQQDVHIRSYEGVFPVARDGSHPQAVDWQLP